MLTPHALSALPSHIHMSLVQSGKDIFTSVLISLVAATGVAASVGAMVAIPEVVVFVMGGLCIANAPMVAHSQIAIAKSVGVRDSVTYLRREIDLLNGEIDFMSKTLGE